MISIIQPKVVSKCMKTTRLYTGIKVLAHLSKSENILSRDSDVCGN